MGPRVVFVAGAGNMECSHFVLATLATWHPGESLEIRLFDANEERLDLMDRLARFLFEENNDEAIIKSSTTIDDFVQGSTDFVFSLSEDCARRMTGKNSMRSLEFLQEFEDPYEIRRGDHNKPTPAENLSERFKHLLEVPNDDSTSAETAIVSAASLILPEGLIGGRAICLRPNQNLARVLNCDGLSWPAEQDQNTTSIMPHQILRWTRGDDLVGELLNEGRENPFRTWIDAQNV